MKKILAVALACTAGAGFAAAAHATAIVQSFETPSLGTGPTAYDYNSAQADQPSAPYADLSSSGVTFYGPSGIAGNGSALGYANAPDGSQVAFIQSYYGDGGSLGFLFPTTVGTTYQVTFELALRPGYSANPLTVSTSEINYAATATSTSWTPYSFQFTAGAGEDGLVFYGASEQGFATLPGDLDVGIDDITISAVGVPAVPEPGTWAMMFAGFVMVGMGLRRRNRIAPRAA